MFNSKSCFSVSTFIFLLSTVSAAACFAENSGVGPTAGASSSSAAVANAALPDAPAPALPEKGYGLGKLLVREFDPGYGGVTGKWDIAIYRGEKVRPFTATEKLHYAWEEENDPVTLFTASLAAGYEHLRDTDPHFGTDSAGYGERLGAAAFRQGVNRMFGDGILPALTHEDPRYYRVGRGPLLSRAVHSAEQVVVRHRDDGSVGINYSGIGGHALADGLPITFYPQVSAKADVALKGFGTSLAADAGIKLVREFLPDLLQAAGLLPKR